MDNTDALLHISSLFDNWLGSGRFLIGIDPDEPALA
jgi:hypothetical protein